MATSDLPPLPRRYRHALALVPDGERRLRIHERLVAAKVVLTLGVGAYLAPMFVEVVHFQSIMGSYLDGWAAWSGVAMGIAMAVVVASDAVDVHRVRRDRRRAIVVTSEALVEEVGGAETRRIRWSEMRRMTIHGGRSPHAHARGRGMNIRFDGAWLPSSADPAGVLRSCAPFRDADGVRHVLLDYWLAPSTLARTARDPRAAPLLADIVTLTDRLVVRRRRATGAIAVTIAFGALMGFVLVPCAYLGLRLIPALNTLDEGRTDKALAILDEAARVIPKAGLVHAERAMALAKAGRADDAVVAARRAVDLDPNVSLYREILALVFDESRPSIDAVHAFVGAWPKRGVGRHRVAVARRLLLLGRVDVARRWLALAERDHGVRREARIALAHADLLEGRPLDALARLPDDQRSDSVWVLLARSLAHRCAGNLDEAARDVEAARATIAGRAPAARPVLLEYLAVVEGAPLDSAHVDEAGPPIRTGESAVRLQLAERIVERCAPP